METDSRAYVSLESVLSHVVPFSLCPESEKNYAPPRITHYAKHMKPRSSTKFVCDLYIYIEKKMKIYSHTYVSRREMLLSTYPSM